MNPVPLLPRCKACTISAIRPEALDSAGVCVDKEWCLKYRMALASGA